MADYFKFRPLSCLISITTAMFILSGCQNENEPITNNQPRGISKQKTQITSGIEKLNVVNLSNDEARATPEAETIKNEPAKSRYINLPKNFFLEWACLYLLVLTVCHIEFLLEFSLSLYSRQYMEPL